MKSLQFAKLLEYVDAVAENTLRKSSVYLNRVRVLEQELRELLTGKTAVPVKIYTEFKHTFGLPAYETSGASAMDVRANEKVKIEPLQTKLVPTGIFMKIPEGYEIQVRPRSGLSLKTSFRVANAPGTIDSDYLGELCIIATNTNPSVEFTADLGERVAQIVLQEVPKIEWVPVPSKEELGTSDRGDKGFGSTGTK